MLSPTTWFADNASAGGASLGVALSPIAATAVEFVAFNSFGDSNSTAQNITWTATDLAGRSYSSDILRIRKGDSLLLTANGAGAALTIDADGNGTYELSGAPGQAFPTAYNTAGTFVVKAKIDGTEVGSLTVVVVSVNLHSPIASEVSFQREKDVDVIPTTETLNVTFTANDSFWLMTSVKQTTATGAALYLKPLRRGSPILESRLNGSSGALLGFVAIDEFTRDTPGLLSALINEATGIGGTTLIMRPFIPNVRWQFDMFASTSTFGGGATTLSVNTSDVSFMAVFDPLTGETVGKYALTLEMPDTEDKYCFNVSAFQASSPEKIVAGVEGVNGGPCKARVDKLVLCKDEKGKLQMELTRKQAAGAKHDVKIQGGPANATLPKFTRSGNQVCPQCFDCAKEVGIQEEEVFAEAATVGEYDVKIGEATFEKAIQVVDSGVALNLRREGTFTPHPEYENPFRQIAILQISTDTLGVINDPIVVNAVNSFANVVEFDGHVCTGGNAGFIFKQKIKQKVWLFFPNPPTLQGGTLKENPNDDPDPAISDVSASPVVHGIYSADAPGQPVPGEAGIGIVILTRQQFETWIEKPAGTIVSNVLKWQSDVTIIRTAGKWVRAKDAKNKVHEGLDTLDVTVAEAQKAKP